jgi:hypothetical protein
VGQRRSLKEGTDEEPAQGCHGDQGQGLCQGRTVGESATRPHKPATHLVAVSMLSVAFPAKAAVGIQEPDIADQISKLLANIRVDKKLSELTPKKPDHAREGQRGVELWGLLRAADTRRWGVGPTTASKIMARKRPHLIPILDVVIRQVIGSEGRPTSG